LFEFFFKSVGKLKKKIIFFSNLDQARIHYDYDTLECDLSTQYDIQRVILTRMRVNMAHAECNFHTNCDFDTHGCDLNTHISDFYMQSVVLTRMSMITTSYKGDYNTHECDFNTHKIDFYTKSTIFTRRV
jgi:hypothetical protein